MPRKPQPRIIENRYPQARCCVCRGKIPPGDHVYHDPRQPRGRRTRHPECVGISPELAAAKAAVEAANEAKWRAGIMAVEDAAREAEAAKLEAMTTVTAWLMRELPRWPRARAELKSCIDQMGGAKNRKQHPKLRLILGHRPIV